MAVSVSSIAAAHTDFSTLLSLPVVRAARFLVCMGMNDYETLGRLSTLVRTERTLLVLRGGDF
jgi:hypothetical protein